MRNVFPFPYLEAGIDPEDMPDPIDALAVKYTGVLGRQQSRYDSAVIFQLLQDAASSSQMPEFVTDVINLDEVIRFRAETNDLPNKILKTREETAAIREEKAKALHAQQEQNLAYQLNMLKLAQEVKEIT